MSAQSNQFKLGVICFVLFFSVSAIASPVLAEDNTDPVLPTVGFVQEGELTFGPPLPSQISFVLNIKDMGNEYAELSIQVINLTNEEGESLNPKSILAFPCEHAEKKVLTNIKDQILTREICLNPDNIEWGTYTAVIQASLGNIAHTTKSIKLIAGPEIPISILTSNITVLGTICPQYVRSNIFRTLLCPTFDETDAKTVGGTNIITITGYPVNDPGRFDKYVQNASGTLVSTDGAGRILVRLNKETDIKTCRYKTDGMICSEALLAFWGSIDAGNYSGIFYLDPKDQATESTKVEISFKAKDYWILPALVILLGLAVSAWITWKLGPQKENIARVKANETIRKKRNYLKASLEEFRGIVKAEKSTYFVKYPDILIEVDFLLQASDEAVKNKLTTIDLNDLKTQMTRIVPLFVRFWSFYLVLYNLHVWGETHRKKLGKANLGKEIELARQELWTADSEENMDSAQDLLTKALLTAHDAHRNYKGKSKFEAPPEFEITQPSIQEEDMEIESEQTQEELKSELRPEKFGQWLIVLLSGIYVVYVTNQTFGTPQDYIYAFLWGSATNAGIDFVNKFFGANIMSAFGITK